jgi:leader peptidase (prepilin peptidase)/N-methyltransferase
LGDVKLAGMLGLFLGRAVAPAMFAALILGSVVGALIIARKGSKEGRKTAIPFGPYLAVGGLVGLFAGDEIVDWYLDNFT